MGRWAWATPRLVAAGGLRLTPRHTGGLTFLAVAGGAPPPRTEGFADLGQSAIEGLRDVRARAAESHGDLHLFQTLDQVKPGDEPLAGGQGVDGLQYPVS